MKADKDQLDQQELERKLTALPQPAPSAALDAAILAAVQADLAATSTPAHRATPAANDAPATPPAARPPARKRWTRWQLPLGLAASFILSLSVVLKLQEHETQTTAPQPLAAPAPAPTSANMESTAPAAHDAQADNAREKRAAVQAARPGSFATPAPAIPAPIKPTPVTPVPAAPAPAAAPTQAAPNDIERTAPPPSADAVATREFQRAPQAAPEFKLAPPAALAPPPPPAPSFGAPPPAVSGAIAERRVQITGSRIISPQQDAVSPETWLAAIDEMLKAGLRRDALEEWPRFRQAYPNYPVPQELLERLQVPKD
ncbi:hypothetical protein [Pseudoduganella violacea]|uniref:Uncharacterized protein n=1 Tax=Pseudoduganella violacea TaxID=1715466 RepID=A0A7W5B8C5_9BURK|nr:hypothetical protein [Pseudoduganella violacea]MBB3118422.1 hypothetical protein [Pseudoduganella violacea]